MRLPKFLLVLLITAFTCSVACTAPIIKSPPPVATVSQTTPTVQNQPLEIVLENQTSAIQTSAIPAALAVQQVYTSQIGVREATGHNDGVMVEKYLKATGLGKGNPWCAAFVRWCFDKANVKTTITAWSPTSFNKNNVVWNGKKILKKPQAGDVFSLWFPSLHRIAHTGFFDYGINASVYSTVEGNTNEASSREGDGVYRKKRSYNATYRISRWIPG